jgi:hypothetical protein
MYFLELISNNLFSDCRPDRIAILAIYMPIIRAEVLAYVDTWNSHAIRKQKDRPNHVAGKPVFNYFFSSVPNRGRPIDPELVDELLADTAEWSESPYILYMYILLILQPIDSDEYLPTDTLQWCSQALASTNINLTTL